MTTEAVTLSEHPERGWLVNAETGAVFAIGGRWKGRELGRIGSHGYPVSTHRGRAFLMHRVVWESCVGPIPQGMVINHLNGIKTDNRLANLEVVTPGENNRHAYAIGLKVHCIAGPRNGNYKVTPEMRDDILRHLGAGTSGSAIARSFGLSGSTVSRIKRGVR